MTQEHTSRGLSTKARILQASLEVFSEKGFDLATIRDISDASKTSLPSLYYYFGSKERLFKELMLGQYSAFLKIFEKNEGDGNAITRLESLLLSMYSEMKQRVAFLRIVRTSQSHYTTVFDDSRSYFSIFHNLLSDIIQGGIDKHEIRQGNAGDMALMIYGFLYVAGDQLCFQYADDFDENRLLRMLHHILDGISSKE